MDPDTEDLIAGHRNHPTVSDNVDERNDEDEVKAGEKRLFILEPACFLLFFAWNISSVVYVNQLLYQTCTVSFGFNETDCALLGNNNESERIIEIEKLVQSYITNIVMAKSLIESILPALCSLFIGPWSDKYGRRPVIMATFCGYFLTYALISLITYLSTLTPINPWYYLIASIPASLSGGTCTLITGVFCYITDVTNEKNRAIKMGILEAAIYLGLLAGSLSSSYLLMLTNGTTVFAVATFLIFLGIIYNYFCIHETVKISEMDLTKSKIREIFRFDLVKDLVVTCFKRRLYYDRAIIIIIMVILASSIFALEGASNVVYLFVRLKFEWTIKDFSYFESISIIVIIFGNLVALYVVKKFFNIQDIYLTIASYVSAVAGCLIVAFAYQPWHLYLATAAAFLRGLSGPLCRAILSQVAPSTDVGKIFSLTTSFEALTPLAASPLYTFVYAMTLDSFPGAYNLITAGIYTGCIALLIMVFLFQRAYRNHGVAYTTINS